MKAFLLTLLAACGPSPRAHIAMGITTEGLSASDVQAYELYVASAAAGSSTDCTALLAPNGLFASNIVLEARALVTAGGNATIPDLAPGNYFAVAFAYSNATGIGAYIGAGCAPTGAIAAGKLTKLTLTVSGI